MSGTAPTPPLATAWTKPLDSYPSAPVIADGRVFVVTIYGVLHALDLRNGAVLWKKGIGTRGGKVAYDRGRVYATDEYGLLYAIDAASGLTLWTATLSSPVPHDGRVYGPYGLVLDGATGERLNPPSVSPSLAAIPAVDGDRIYYACQGASALVRSTSAFAWKTYDDLDCSSDSPPAVLHAGRLYATQARGTSNVATVYDAATGAGVGTFAPKSTPAFAGNTGLFVENGVLQARDATTYAARWSFTGGADNVFQTPALIAGNDVYYADAERVHVLDLNTGAARSSISTPDRVMKGMAIAQGTLVLSTGSGVTAIRGVSAPTQPGPADSTPAPVDLGPPAPLPGASTHAHVNAAHTAAINLSDPAPPLKRRWRVWIDARQAIVADGRVFAIGPIAARLNPTTGATLWTYPGKVKHAAYDRGRLFVTTEEEGLVALDPETGAKLWSVNRGTGAPVAADGELYQGGSYSVTRIDPATGAEVWRYLGDSMYGSTNRRTVSLDGPYVYPGGICATLSRATGQPVKTLRGCPASEHPFAPVSGGHMFESGFGQAGVHDFDVERGVLVNRVGSIAPPAVIGNLLVTSLVGGLNAYEFPSWTPRWKYRERGEDTIAVPPLIVGRHVYFSTSMGELRGLDVQTGQQVWSDSLGENLTHYSTQVGVSMGVGDGLLIVPTGSRLTAYESAA
ncbi:PQQ-binding-like beta-propeller repeat protein [Solirubrobacter phytolaccae]|uniref:PQQ-binding-like beta-propeller repeat protein n=1 Tax=Solirubrobacter phytolaccae TaxID=1404360 RepID=A0A9X3N851_9ACTN|nr:PQQ-binding-like beta-propeller repeat protein [Solirubrobacter phytolaccae]MDA0181720.1 PQQ-binding-like beta-propeller repeat protein [Solirubrobacter phytolaccae]